MERYGLDPTLHPEQEFKAELDEIISTPLTPENINTYATGALDQLINLAENVTNSYGHLPTISFETDKQTETAAFSFFKLRDIGAILDHISEKAAEIDRLDEVIERAHILDRVITPPDPSRGILGGNGEGMFREKEIVPRLKTVLFILSNDFGVNVKDHEQVKIVQGPLEEGMFRDESYVALEVQPLDRTVLVCDEKGNLTFVFDTKKLQELGISNAELIDLTKSEVKKLIEEHAEAGRRIVYSSASFVPKVIEALENPQTLPKPPVQKQAPDVGQYLYPKAEQDILSSLALAAKLGLSRHTVSKIVADLTESGALGDVNMYRFGAARTHGFTPDQQQIIRSEIEARGFFTPAPPKDVLSAKGLARVLGIDRESLVGAIDDLQASSALGKTSIYRFGPVKTQGYTPEQQELIRKVLEEKGAFAQPPEGVLSVPALAGELGISKQTVQKQAVTLMAAGELGETKSYKFGAKVTTGLTPDQQELIKTRLEQRGLFLPQAPEGTLSTPSVADALAVSHQTIRTAIEELQQEGLLKDIATFRFGGQQAEGLTPDQQIMIRNKLEQTGRLAPLPPTGVLSIKSLADQLNINRVAIERALKILESRDELGAVEVYKFGTNVVQGFTPDQQQQIYQLLEERGLFRTQVARNNQYTGALQVSEDIKSVNGLAKALGISNDPVEAAISALMEEGALGDIKTYRFGARAFNGFNQEQQEIIRARLLEKGSLAPKAPEGVISVAGLAKELKVKDHIVAKSVTELDETGQLGQREKYKFGVSVTYGFNQEQQQRIISHIKQTLKRRSPR